MTKTAVAPVDITNDSTPEEVAAFVEQAAADVEADRAGEQPENKTDGGKLADEEAKPAEIDSGSDGSAKVGDEAGTESQAPKWLDDDLKAEVAAYGLDEKDLADYASREEVERTLRFFDRSAQEAGRKAKAESDKAKETPAEKMEPKEGQYEINKDLLDAEEYDQALVAELTKMRDHYESRFDALESRTAEADARAEVERFDGIVDSLGHADLFGKTGKENSKQLFRRTELMEELEIHRIGLQQVGRPSDLSKALVNRVAQMVFADELGKKALKARTKKIQNQSNGRQGGGDTRPQDPHETLMEVMEREFDRLDNQS